MTRMECEANIKLVLEKLENVHTDIDKIDLLLRGKEGRNGLVRDVNELKSKSQFASNTVGIIVGVIASIVSSYVIHIIVG